MTASPLTAGEVDLSRVHMIGVGGAGMSGIARILLDLGGLVSGSDARDSAELAALAARGANVHVGHDAAHVESTGTAPTAVIVSKKAIPADNPELVAAREGGIPVVTRSEVLGTLARAGRSILVTGTHGKTSTTSMLIAALLGAGKDPSFAVGGTVLQFGTNARGGADPLFVAEADESDGSLEHYDPDIVVLTNAEPDHLDHFGTAEAYFDVFDAFLARIPANGALVVCLDDPGARERARRAAARGVRILGYGMSDEQEPAAPDTVAPDTVAPDPPAVEGDLPIIGSLHEIVVDESGTRGALTLDGTDAGELRLGTPGEHMALNALAALLSARQAGAATGGLLDGLAGFGGVGRRFEYKGAAAGVAVYDDYAHHPTEVGAVLAAARDVVAARSGAGRLVAVFQPHMYSRTRIFAAEFGAALSAADIVVVLDVYGAREEPEPGVDAELVAGFVTAPAHTAVDLDEALRVVIGLSSRGDVVLTIGAGDITTLGPRILSGLEEVSTA